MLLCIIRDVLSDGSTAWGVRIDYRDNEQKVDIFCYNEKAANDLLESMFDSFCKNACLTVGYGSAVNTVSGVEI